MNPATSPIEIQSPVSRIRNGIFPSNTYFYQLPHSQNCFVIDPGLDFDAIDAHLTAQGLNPTAALCTHGHFDHLGSAQHLKNKYQTKLYLHASDLKISKSANFLLMACKIDFRVPTPTIDFFIREDNLELSIEGVKVKWIHVPGHTPGSCFIVIDDSIFTGDTLYKKAVGLSDFPGENREQLIQSILKIWDLIPESYSIYPGHGGSDNFGNIKINNHPLRALIGLSPLLDRTSNGGLDEK